MKIISPVVKALNLLVIVILFSSCSSTVPFIYNAQYTASSENKITTENKIHLTMKDLRADPELIAYVYNNFGMKVKDIKIKDPNISKAILTKFKNELTKKGYILTEDIDDSDMVLILSVTKLFAKMRPGFSRFTTKTDCCIKIALSTNNNNAELYETDVCGNNVLVKGARASKKLVSEALSLSIDDALSKLLNDEGLINAVSK
ncbi:MAG: YajG family lipoprotein [Salinivirgaceae bacterium]|jgi:uncharacterized lipoprotein YajG|nr:YajG family lipoprotein [Salinivirgaceae bacterium]